MKMGMKWAVPVIVSILVIGLLYSSDTQTADAHSVCVVGLSGCNDNNPCTSDSCVAAPLLSHLPSITSGHCENTPRTGSCGDGNACTTDGTCSAGVCTGITTVANGTPCADGDACNGDETCQSGTCTAGTALDCDDGKECTTDTCDSQLGCENQDVPSGTTCGSLGEGVCDLQDRCDGSGSCIDEVAEVTVSCRAASNDCDVEEFCDGAGSCPADALEPAGTVCGIPADGVKLNCDGTGICVTTTVITCGLGTTLNPTTLECEANVCDPNVADDDDDDDEEDDDDD